MPLERTPQKIAGDGRHYGPGVRYVPAAQVGPSQQEPIINAAAQTNRASQIKRNAPDGTGTRSVDRAASYPGRAANYGTT